MTQDANNQEWRWDDWCKEAEYSRGRKDALKECIAILEMNLDTGDGKIYSSSEPQYKNRTLIELLKSKLC